MEQICVTLRSPSVQEDRRFASINTETLAIYSNSLEVLATEYALDVDRIWNCDESDGSTAEDSQLLCPLERFLRHDSGSERYDLSFAYTSRITKKTVVTAGAAVGKTHLSYTRGTHLYDLGKFKQLLFTFNFRLNM